MGNNHSHYEHQLREERERSRKQHEAAENHRRWLESERDRIAAEKERELEAERQARAEKERALALQHQEDMRRAQEERDRIQQEKERAVAENHTNELRLLEEQARKQREYQEELQRVQEEKVRLQAEDHEREVRRIQAEKEEQTRRAEEELKRLEEAHRMEEEVRALKEQIRLEEERKKMEEERRKMQELARKIEEEARKRVEKEIYLREEAERNLQEGIPPVKYPTGEEFQLMRQKLGYQEGYLHVAVTGFSGCGKSSLINALRGLRSSYSPKKGIAQIGTSETTTEAGRYSDPSRQWLAWYDVPGAGTVNIRDWQYFNDQGLYIFDVIIVVAGDRFTETDIELLFHCKRFGIAAFVVRSKSDQHIANVIKIMKNDDDGDSDDESDSEERKGNRLLEGRGKYIADTRNNFQALLKQVGLPQQKVYIVCDDAVRSLVKNSKTTGVIDEVELMRDLTQVAKDKCPSFFQ